MKRWYKDPDSVLDYLVRWIEWLDSGDTISTSSWVIEDDDGTLVIDSDENTTITTTVWLSAGTNGITYTLTNTVVTAGARTIEKSFTLTIQESTEDLPNSYCSCTDTQSYFDGRLNTDAWDDATSTNQQKALIQATRMIDRLNFIGKKTAETQIQQFPRDADTAVPTYIENACSELALSLLDGIDLEQEADNARTLSVRYATVALSYDKDAPPEHIIAGIPSIEAWRFLRPFIRDPQNINIQRVN